MVVDGEDISSDGVNVVARLRDWRDRRRSPSRKPSTADRRQDEHNFENTGRRFSGRRSPGPRLPLPLVLYPGVPGYLSRCPTSPRSRCCPSPIWVAIPSRIPRGQRIPDVAASRAGAPALALRYRRIRASFAQARSRRCQAGHPGLRSSLCAGGKYWDTAGHRVRITGQLIDADTGKVWARNLISAGHLRRSGRHHRPGRGRGRAPSTPRRLWASSKQPDGIDAWS